MPEIERVAKEERLHQPAAQHSVHPTGGSRRVFKQVAWREIGSGKVASPRPAHPRVTHTVGQPYELET